MRPKHKFQCPGMFHPLEVRIITQKQMDKYLGEKGVLGCYEHDRGLVHVVKELAPNVKEHTFFHEIAHHIRDTLSDVKNEETKCDILGAYLMKLQEAREHILTELNK